MAVVFIIRLPVSFRTNAGPVLGHFFSDLHAFLGSGFFLFFFGRIKKAGRGRGLDSIALFPSSFHGFKSSFKCNS